MASLARAVAYAGRKTTGIVGVPRAADPIASLVATYKETLGVTAAMPADSAYRKNVEALTTSRLNVVEKTTDFDSIEAQIGAGQMEEVMEQASHELSLAKMMTEWKPWEPLEEA